MKTLQSSSRGRGRGRGGRGGGRGRRHVDERFASMYTDPRFKLSKNVQKNKRTIDPDERIAKAAASDERFSRYFKQEEEEFPRNDIESEEEEDEEEESLNSEGEGFEEENAGEENEDMQEDSEIAWEESDLEYIEAKRRLAIVKCDWDHIRAADLYAVLFHALPLGGQLEDVSIYMSKFGEKMIEYERTHGPDLWSKGEEGNKKDKVDMTALPIDNEDGNSNPSDDEGWVNDNPAMLYEEGEDGEYFSNGKYRKYEMDRLRYYYAIATFDSPETAAAVYKELDGMDIEASGVVLDLRYVDDEETFENPVSRADRIPHNFKPLASFKSAALSQSRFRISWDQDDHFRHHSIQDSFTGTTAEDDLEAYLAPPDSEEEDDTGISRHRAARREDTRKRYSALLQEIGGLQDDTTDSAAHFDDAQGSDDPDGDESGSDDDSLNRFSDVEMESIEDDQEEPMGDMEATLDLDVDAKAAKLQHDAQRAQRLKKADLGSKAELKYKERRKEMRKAKKEMIVREKEDARTATEAETEARRQRLRELTKIDDSGVVQLSKKEKRKLHAQKVKTQIHQERLNKKKMRAAQALGVVQEVREKEDVVRAQAATEKIDERFQKKLLTDSRYHLDVSEKDRKLKQDVVDLAASVAAAKRVQKRTRTDTTESQTHNGTASENVDDVVDFFLKNQSKKHKAEKKASK